MGEEQSYAPPFLCDPITVAMRNSFDDSVQAQAPKVIGHFAYRVKGWGKRCGEFSQEKKWACPLSVSRAGSPK